MKKNIMFSMIIILIFFLLIESAQRVRYWLRYDHVYWLIYGLVKQPSEKIMETKYADSVEEIKVCNIYAVAPFIYTLF